MAYQKILVGTDGSETARRAIQTAAEIAGRTGAELIVATVYSAVPPDEIAQLEQDAPDDDQWQVAAVAQADELVVQGREIAAHSGTESTGRSVSGEKPGTALVDLAEDIGCDLIVTGNVGMTGAKRFLLGSVPDFIEHHAECDVLIDHIRD